MFAIIYRLLSFIFGWLYPSTPFSWVTRVKGYLQTTSTIYKLELGDAKHRTHSSCFNAAAHFPSFLHFGATMIKASPYLNTIKHV